MSNQVTTVEELWREIMKDEVKDSKSYHRMQYYTGQAIATYGEEACIKSYNENLEK